MTVFFNNFKNFENIQYEYFDSNQELLNRHQ